MNAATRSIMTRVSDAAQGRVVVGIVVVLTTVLILPVPVWLVVLAVAMASRPRDAAWNVPTPHPTLRRWLLVTLVFLGGVVLTMLGKPLTGHGVQLAIWFALLPAIGMLFWLQGRRTHTVGALWLGATAGACTAGIVALVQVGVLHHPRATGITANSITFGNMALVFGVVSVALHRLVDLPRRVALATGLGAGALGLAASIMSGSRGGWLAVPMLIALVVWQAREELTPRLLARLAIGLASVVVLSNTVSDGMPTSRASASVSNVSSYQSTSPRSESTGSSEGARIEAWRSSAHAFAEQPMTGVGWGNLATHFDRDAALGIRNERIATFDHAHNQLLGAAANGGLIGLSTMLALFAVPSIGFVQAIRTRDRRRRTLGVTGIAVLASFASFGLTESVLENLVPVTLLAVLVAALCAELDRTGSEAPDERVPARRATWGPDAHRQTHRASPFAHRWSPLLRPLY